MPNFFPEGDEIRPSDDEARAAAKWCSQLYASVGNRSSPFPEGCLPLPSDDFDRLMIKVNILKGP